jgi:peptidoglycan/xylan/chitin deacetylase (PgdA/CDA1 family)
VVAAAVALWENIDLGRLVPELAESPLPAALPETGPPATPAEMPFEVALFASPRNAAFYPEEDYHARTLAAWRRLLSGAGATVRDISTAAELAELGTGVVVIPETPCLSTAERAAVAEHLRRGGHVVADWAVGARDRECAWLGWEMARGLAGADDLREIPEREALYLTLPSGLPLSAGFDPGTRVELRPDPSLAARIDGARVYWSDWGLDPAPDESGGGADAAAVARRTADGARIVWLGFRLGQGATPRDAELLHRLVRNGVHWAAGIPLAEVAPWPHSRRSALMLAVDVESQPERAAPLAELLAGESLPSTWFAVSQQVAGDDVLPVALARAGEIGAQTPDNAPVAGLDGNEQQVRLRRVSADLQDWAGSRPAGLRPPGETFDEATLDAWQRAGGSYLVALNDARSASPELHRGAPRADSLPVIVLPRLVKDDYNVFVQDGALRSARLVEAWAQGTAKVHALGGVAVLATHTQIMDSDTRREAVVQSLLSARRQGDWWLATGSELAAWWRSRAAVRVLASMAEPESADADTVARIRGDEDSRWSFQVVAGPEGLAGGWLELVVPDLEGRVPLCGGEPVRYELTPYGLRVPLGELAPGEGRSVELVPAPQAGEAPAPGPHSEAPTQ